MGHREAQHPVVSEDVRIGAERIARDSDEEVLRPPHDGDEPLRVGRLGEAPVGSAEVDEVDQSSTPGNQVGPVADVVLEPLGGETGFLVEGVL